MDKCCIRSIIVVHAMKPFCKFVHFQNIPQQRKEELFLNQVQFRITLPNCNKCELKYSQNHHCLWPPLRNLWRLGLVTIAMSPSPHDIFLYWPLIGYQVCLNLIKVPQRDIFLLSLINGSLHDSMPRRSPPNVGGMHWTLYSPLLVWSKGKLAWYKWMQNTYPCRGHKTS